MWEMFRAREPQRQLLSAKNQYSDLIGKESFYALLAEHGEKLFWDYNFESMYTDGGVQCVHASNFTRGADKVSVARRAPGLPGGGVCRGFRAKFAGVGGQRGVWH